MKKGMAKLIYYRVYPFELIVSTQSKKNFLELLKDNLPDEEHSELNLFDGHYDARTVMFSGGQTAIHFNKYKDSSISHEVFHAVHFLMDRLNCNLTMDSCEAYAYLIQYITDEIYNKDGWVK